MSTDLNIIEPEEPGMELNLATPAPVTLFRTDDPTEVIARATAIADALHAVVKQKQLTVRIAQSEHAKVEAWTLLGTLLGVFPVCVWTRKVEDGWEARVEARTLAGQIVGAAEAQCLHAETTWKNRDDYALRSMAQTRATSKALRQPLGFVMTLAGFDATPAEEMPSETRGAPFQPPEAAAGASAGQVKNIWRLVKKIDKAGKVTEVELRERMVDRFGTADPADLSKRDATTLIDALKGMAGEETTG